MVIEEWLDTLPYTDFAKTCELLTQAVQDTNQLKLKHTQRLELIHLYHRPYQYLIDSQLNSSTYHTQQAVLSLQTNLNVLKELSLAMGVSCRLSLDEALNRRTLWIQAKPPLDAILMSMKYFSEALICCYLEYYPTPKTIWREINFLYDFTESIHKENIEVSIFSNDDAKQRLTVATAYKQIVLTSLIDPYHLPFGAIWEIYQAMYQWSNHTELLDFKEVEDATSIMVMDLKNDIRPVPYSKFNKKLSKDRVLRMLYVGSLVDMLKSKLRNLNASSVNTTSIPIAAHYAEYVLQQLIEELELPHKRVHKRKDKNLMVRVAQGFNNCYYYVNQEREFSGSLTLAEDDANSIIEVVTNEYVPEYTEDIWELQDYSKGGYSLRKEMKADSTLRVGELLAIYTGTDGIYNLGVVRWLMIRPGNMYKIGIQVLCREVIAARIRSKDSSDKFSRAFFSGSFEEKTATLITKDVTCELNRQYELDFGEQTFRVHTDKLMCSTMAMYCYSISKI